MSVMSVFFVVHGVPAPQGSKNQFGAEANPRTRPWRAAVSAAAASARGPEDELLDGAVSVAATFRFVRPKAHYRTGRHQHELRPDAPAFMASGPDLDKLCRAVGDSLTGTVIRDDRQIARWSAEKVWANTASAEIQIWELGQRAVRSAA